MVRRLSLVALAGFILAPSLGPRAEVVVRTDSRGHYIRTEVVTTGARGEPVIWGLRGRMARRADVLNPRGDQNGDQWPVIVESSQFPIFPWVVWSRFDGTGYRLAWSHWNLSGWSPVAWVSPEPAAGDELDPDLAFDADGQAYVTWSRVDDGVSKVYLSVWLRSRWSSGVVVSELGVDSRYPVIAGFRDGVVHVDFLTAQGDMQQQVTFAKPGTITDDINPLEHLRLVGTPIYVGNDGEAKWDDR